MGYKRPKFNRYQKWFLNSGVHRLDSENFLVVIKNVLSSSEVDMYLDQAANVERESGKSGFGYKPRVERCYTLTGKPLVYSRVTHKTSKYPEHVSATMKTVKEKVDITLADNRVKTNYHALADGIDIVYDDTFPRGGSVAAHKDQMAPYGRVDILSFGQTRLMRIRREADKQVYNVEMPHNSVIVMLGPTFQDKYTHEVPKLGAGETVGARNSINVRYLLQ